MFHSLTSVTTQQRRSVKQIQSNEPHYYTRNQTDSAHVSTFITTTVQLQRLNLQDSDRLGLLYIVHLKQRTASDNLYEK